MQIMFAAEIRLDNQQTSVLHHDTRVTNNGCSSVRQVKQAESRTYSF
jgi:hypothetical protein